MIQHAELPAVTKADANNRADYSATALQLSQSERKKKPSPLPTFILTIYIFNLNFSGADTFIITKQKTLWTEHI